MGILLLQAVHFDPRSISLSQMVCKCIRVRPAKCLPHVVYILTVGKHLNWNKWEDMHLYIDWVCFSPVKTHVGSGGGGLFLFSRLVNQACKSQKLPITNQHPLQEAENWHCRERPCNVIPADEQEQDNWWVSLRPGLLCLLSLSSSGNLIQTCYSPLQNVWWSYHSHNGGSRGLD